MLPARMAGVVRLATTATTVIAAGWLLGACGKGASTQSVGASAATSAAPRPATPGTGASRLTHAQALAFARAVNLTAADLPGFSVSAQSHQRETATEKSLLAALVRCEGGLAGAGAQQAQGPAEQHSQEFTRRASLLAVTVSSAVSFQPTAQLAARELALLRSPKTKRCLTGYLDRVLGAKHFPGGSFRHVSIAQGTPPAAGTRGGFGWRIKAVIEIQGLPVPFYLDILGFVYGPAEVRLLSSGVLVPFPAGVQEDLYNLLVARARSHAVSGP